MAGRGRSFRYLLHWLIVSTRGGMNRARIIRALRDEPQNANQLGNLLGLDYRAVRHHLRILEENRIVMSIGERYGKMYFLSPEMEENYALFKEIWTKFRT
jgi:DNA-binding transcriptional ArsR family regulator